MSRNTWARRGLTSMKTRNKGFTLLELIIAVGFLGGLAAWIVVTQNRADSGVTAHQLSTGTTTMAAQIRKVLGPSKTYSALSATWLNSNGLVTEPFTWDGTNVKDPMGNTVSVSGATTTFALTIGGTQQLPKDLCNNFVSTLSTNANAISIGATATVSSGAVSGGTAYKTAGSTTPSGAALSSCADTSTVIAMQFK